LKLLIKALGLLKKMGQQVHLLVGGEFWEDVEEYRELILKEEIQDWITIHNRYIPNEEVPTFFSAADFFVAPYNEGTQSGAVKIALGFGLPIVASQIILDTSEFYKDHVQVFPVGNVSELAKAIISISNVTSKPGIINPTDNDWKTLVDMLEQFALGTSL
jgi:glycosyltransferase involved in cell wall biosynthesis